MRLRWLSPVRLILSPFSRLGGEKSASSAKSDHTTTCRSSLERVVCSIAGACLAIFLLSTAVHKWRYGYKRINDVELLRQITVSPQAAALPGKGEILCWAQTSQLYHDTRALAVSQTWLRKCDHGVLFTNAPFKMEHNIPYRTVFAGIPDSYDNLFYKSRYAFYYIAEIMQADFDWIVKADDDTYLIVENLRKYLRTLDSSQPYFVGYRMKPHLANGYNGGGAGYVLSRKALQLFATHAYADEIICPDDLYEDVGIARCLANLGILPHKTVNEQGQQRFNTYHLDKTLGEWTLDGTREEWVMDPFITGMDGIASDLISFHHVSPLEMKMVDHLLYRVTVDGKCAKEKTEL